MESYVSNLKLGGITLEGKLTKYVDAMRVNCALDICVMWLLGSSKQRLILFNYIDLVGLILLIAAPKIPHAHTSKYVYHPISQPNHNLLSNWFHLTLVYAFYPSIWLHIHHPLLMTHLLLLIILLCLTVNLPPLTYTRLLLVLPRDKEGLKAGMEVGRSSTQH